MAAGTFRCPDFIVGTVDAVINRIIANCTNFSTIIDENLDAVYAIATHPKKSIVCYAGYSGLVKMWDYAR